MNWKQHESEDVIVHPALHEGDGAITRRRFFSDATKLPVKIEVWELEPGSERGQARPRGRGYARRVLLLHCRRGRDVDG